MKRGRPRRVWSLSSRMAFCASSGFENSTTLSVKRSSEASRKGRGESGEAGRAGEEEGEEGGWSALSRSVAKGISPAALGHAVREHHNLGEDDVSSYIPTAFEVEMRSGERRGKGGGPKWRVSSEMMKRGEKRGKQPREPPSALPSLLYP
jgi:hypothetical protein